MTNNITLSGDQQKQLANAIGNRILKDTGETLKVWVSEGGEIEIPIGDSVPTRDDQLKQAVCNMKNITYSHSKKQIVFQLMEVPEND